MKINKYNLILLVAFLVGFTGLCYEIVATKILFYFFSENSLSVSTVIAIFLLGLAIGSFIFSNLVHKIKDMKEFILTVQVSIACYALLVFPNFDIVPTIFNLLYNNSDVAIQVTLLNKFLISFAYLIVPTVLMGMCLPAVLTMMLEFEEDIAKKISLVYGVDLMGAVLGSLLSGYVFIPFIGIKALIFFTVAINLLTGLILISDDRKKLFKYSLLCIVLFGVGIFCLKPLETSAPIYETGNGNLDLGSAQKYQKKDPNVKIFSKNSPYGEVSVIRETMFNEKVLSMYINNRMECTTAGCTPGHIEKANASEVHFANDTIKESSKKDLKVLNIGLGCGITLGTLAKNPKIKSIDVVEINQTVVEGSKYFTKYTADVLKNPKVKLFINDGYYHLFKGKRKYDLIIVDIENPAIMESSKLYTKEFYEIIKNSLSPDGAFAIWAYRPNERIQAINYNTLSSVFPYVTLKISGKFNDIYFFAKNTPIKKIKQKTSDKEFLKSLQNSRIKKVNTLNNSALTTEWMTTGLISQ